MPQWIKDAVNVKQPRVRMQLSATEDTMIVPHFTAESGDLRIQAHGETHPKTSQVKVLVQKSGLNVGFAWRDKEWEWHLVQAKKWYDASR